MELGIHGLKIEAAIKNPKVPKSDKKRLRDALEYYKKWIEDLNNTSTQNVDIATKEMIKYLNEYKLHLDVNTIFDSETTRFAS